MASLSAVIFDLGDVLVGMKKDHELLASFAEFVHLRDEDLIRAVEKFRYQFKLYTTSHLSTGDFYQKALEIFCMQIPYEEFERRWCDVFHSIEGMEELLRELIQLVPIGLLSNTNPLHWDTALSQYPFLRLIERPTLSFQIARRKPSSDSYMLAAGNLGISPSNCLFVDDQAENVAGAIAVGMQAVQFVDEKTLRKTLEELKLLRVSP